MSKEFERKYEYQGLVELGECIHNIDSTDINRVLKYEQCKKGYEKTIFRLEKLPDIVLMELLGNLSPEESADMCMISKNLNKICTSKNFDRYWQRVLPLSEEDHILLISEDDKTHYQKLLEIQKYIKIINSLENINKDTMNILFEWLNEVDVELKVRDPSIIKNAKRLIWYYLYHNIISRGELQLLGVSSYLVSYLNNKKWENPREPHIFGAWISNNAYADAEVKDMMNKLTNMEKQNRIMNAQAITHDELFGSW